MRTLVSVGVGVCVCVWMNAFPFCKCERTIKMLFVMFTQAHVCFVQFEPPSIISVSSSCTNMFRITIKTIQARENCRTSHRKMAFVWFEYKYSVIPKSKNIYTYTIILCMLYRYTVFRGSPIGYFRDTTWSTQKFNVFCCHVASTFQSPYTSSHVSFYLLSPII